MSNKKFKFKAVPTGGSVPAPGSVGNSPYTLFAKQLSATTFTPIVTDGNGKALEMVTSSGGGGGSPATPQTLSEVLTTGNKLEGKEIEGDLVVKNVYTNGGNTTGEYRISGNNEGIELSGSGEGYSSILKVGGSWNVVRWDFYYPVDTGTSSGYWQIGVKGIQLDSEVPDHSMGMQFRATDKELFYTRYIDGKSPLTFTIQDSGIHSQFPDVELGGDNYITFYINSTNGMFLSKYIKPTRDEEYTQKKYVDDKIAAIGAGGGSGATAQNIQKTIETGNTYTFSDATTHLKHDFKNTSFEVGEDNTYKSSINLKKDSIKVGYEIPGQFNGLEARDFTTTIYSYELFIKGDRYNNTNNPNIDKVAVVNYQTGRVNTLTYAEVGYKIVGANNEIFIGTDNSTGANTNRTANVSVGTDNFKSLAADSTSNIAMGYSAGKSTTGSRNTFLGTFAGYNQKNGSDNIFIGYNAGGTSENSTGNIFIGANAGAGLKGQVSLADIKESSPIFEEYTKDTNLARDLGFDTTTQKFNTTANVIIGYQSTALANTINRAIGSIGIGYQPLTGAGWRLYNSINIGNFIYGKGTYNYYNVITIGNHIRPGSTYGSLHIDNGIDKRISSADTLIWGQFENAKYSYKKQLKINGIFSLNTSYMEKADDLRNHRLLVRQDVTGQVKYVDLSDLPFTKPNPNLLRSSSLPMMAPNDTGTGISSIQEEATGKFVRYTPTAGKRVWLYGFKFPGNGNGKYSRSVLVRHNHTADLTVWGQTVKPNTWTRIKQDAYTSTSEWQIFDIVTPDVVVDLKQYKLEESPVSTDWVAHVDDTLGSGVEEAPADGQMYVRQNGRWVRVTKELLQNILN